MDEGIGAGAFFFGIFPWWTQTQGVHQHGKCPQKLKVDGQIFSAYIFCFGLRDNAHITYIKDRLPNFRKGMEDVTFLGKGAYGSVDRVVRDGLVVARKTVQLTGPITSECLRELGSFRLLHETDDVRQERVIRLINVSMGDKAIELYLEYMAGGTLHAYMKSHQREMDDLKRPFSEQLLQGVCFIHSHNLVHRDLKPDNILLTGDLVPQLKIADFGLAQVIGGCIPRSPVVCTLYYRAPEVLAGDMYNKAMDNWSVGCIIMQMYTGNGPFFIPSNAIDKCPFEAGEQQAAAILKLDQTLKFPQMPARERKPPIVWLCRSTHELQLRGNDRLLSVSTALLRPNPNLRILAADALAILADDPSS